MRISDWSSDVCSSDLGLPVEAAIEPLLIDLAYDLDLPLVATNEAFFPTAADYEAHDALLCIAEGAYIGQADRPRLTPDHAFKSAVQMLQHFVHLPAALDTHIVSELSRERVWQTA